MFYDKISSRIRRIITRLGSSELITGLLLAVVVGVIAGLGAVVFRWLISSFTTLFFDEGGDILRTAHLFLRP
jgi:ABC-type nitrate/sulfonate/bicarbonate transport system permease component